MRTTIWKFQLNGDESQLIEMPIGAGSLSIQVINNVPFLYAVVNLDTPETETKELAVIFTGEDMPTDKGFAFIGTYAITKPSASNASVLNTHVGHVFEISPIEDVDAEELRDVESAFADDKEEAYEEFKGTAPYYEGVFTLLRSGLDPEGADKVLRAIFDAGYDA